MPDARPLIAQGSYFVVHAPRQTGKTTTLATLAEALTAEGDYAAELVSCERAEAAEDDFAAAELMVLDAIRSSVARLPAELRPPDPWPSEASPGSRLHAALAAWADSCPRPLVLFFDEIDALRGQSLISVLRQLRSGYTDRPNPFPASVVLCGLRDVRDYKAASGGDPTRLGTASPFNIKVASLRISDFTEDQIRELYGQHTAETGQEFTEGALRRAWKYTQGQPWLVNALAAEIIDWMRIRPPEPITDAHMEEAKERMILRRHTHLDSLAAKLMEPRVRRIMDPLIAGILPELDDTFNDDVSYLRDLGLLGQGKPLAVANPIYREVIVRVLGSRTENVIQSQPGDFVGSDGRLDLRRMLEDFADFWRRNGEALRTTSSYPEAADQLILMAYFHRMINGTGQIDREYALGRGRVDLLIRWPYTGPDGRRAWQREAIELKTRRQDATDPLEEGLAQLDGYLDQLGLDRGVLVIFDERPDAPKISERLAFSETRTGSGRPVTVLEA